MDAERRKELHIEVCMYEDHEEDVSVPVAELRALLADSEAMDAVKAVADNLRKEAKEASEDEPEVADALDFGAISIDTALGQREDG